MKIAEDRLRTVLGISEVTFKPGRARLAIVDTALQA
jgi:hypothetical protein